MAERLVKKAVMVVASALLVFLAGCGGGNQQEEKKAPAPQKLLVVNVLQKEFYDDAHIAGSINVFSADLAKVAQTWDKEVPIVVYCSNYMCSASSADARKLQGLGFKNVFAYEGGMAEWYQLSREDDSYKVEGPATQEYLNVKVAAPSEKPSDIKVITAQELRDKLRA